MSVARSTPFKRMRSPTGRVSYDPMCTPSFDGFDDATLDNVRSQKRYLSEVSHELLISLFLQLSLLNPSLNLCSPGRVWRDPARHQAKGIAH